MDLEAIIAVIKNLHTLYMPDINISNTFISTFRHYGLRWD